jgi:hypothetical protein
VLQMVSRWLLAARQRKVTMALAPSRVQCMADYLRAPRTRGVIRSWPLDAANGPLRQAAERRHLWSCTCGVSSFRADGGDQRILGLSAAVCDRGGGRDLRCYLALAGGAFTAGAAPPPAAREGLPGLCPLAGSGVARRSCKRA